MGMSSAGPLTRLLSDTGLNKTEEGNRIFQQVVIIEITAVILFSFLTELYRKAITIPVVLSVTGELVLSLVLIILFSRYFLTYFFRKLDTSSRAHETLIASIIAFMLILGFFGQLYGFNSAIIALFLGIMLREFIKERPLVAEKVSTVTYGFFEPLFFIGLGLYFVRITPELLFLGALFLLTGLSLKPIAGWLFAKKVNVGRIRNALGTSVNGGVDAALLVVAFTLTMVSRYYYSVIMFAITLLTLVVPLLFNIGTPIVPKDKSRYV
jgi:Kef-type K+ transport systems, membrane components